jgi:inner membrane transporter RhtA
MLHGNSGSHRAAHEIFFTSAPAWLRPQPRMMASMTTRTSSALLVAIAALVVAMVSYQCGASLAKHLFPVVGAEGATAFRLGISAVLLALLRRPWRSPATKPDRRALWGYGLSLGAMNLCFYLSLRTIPLGIAVALEFTGPLAFALMHSRRVLDVVWIVLIVAGLTLLLPLRGAGALDPVGVAFALAAGVGWALYIVFGQKAGAAYGANAVTLGTAIGALVAIPVGVAHAGAALFSLDLLPWAIGVAVLSSALPYSLEMLSLTRLPTRTFSTLLSLEPAIAALAGVALLHEHLDMLQWLAIGAIVVAAAGTALGARRPPVSEPFAN